VLENAIQRIATNPKSRAVSTATDPTKPDVVYMAAKENSAQLRPSLAPNADNLDPGGAQPCDDKPTTTRVRTSIATASPLLRNESEKPTNLSTARTAAGQTSLSWHQPSLSGDVMEEYGWREGQRRTERI